MIFKNNLEINKTVYGEIKTRKSLFPENKQEPKPLHENLHKKEVKLVETSPENIPSNKLNKIKEKQKFKENITTLPNENQSEGVFHRPPITQLMQEHPIQKGIRKKLKNY